jgi:hypothetical protein
MALALALSLIGLIQGSSAGPPETTLARPDSIGASVHSLTTREADLAKLADLKWIRADVAELQNTYSFAGIVTNAQSRGIKILGIPVIWTFHWNWNFTLDDWQQAVTKASYDTRMMLMRGRYGTNPSTHQTL